MKRIVFVIVILAPDSRGYVRKRTTGSRPAEDGSPLHVTHDTRVCSTWRQSLGRSHVLTFIAVHQI